MPFATLSSCYRSSSSSSRPVAVASRLRLVLRLARIDVIVIDLWQEVRDKIEVARYQVADVDRSADQCGAATPTPAHRTVYWVQM